MTTVRVRFIGQDDGLGKTATEIETKAGKLDGIFQGIGQTIGQSLSNLPGKVAEFAGGAIDKASDVNESLSKVNTVFKDQGVVIEEWASNAAKNFGLSKGAALDAAGGLGNMFTQLGIGTDQAAAMSQSVGGLAADFASFHNADISSVLDAQSAAFRGEYDALQKYVPTINAAAVEQKALAMTHKASTKELTAQEKALATYQLMVDGAGEAAGDFERTSGGLANQQRIQAAEWENLQATIGQKLIPVKMALTKLLVGLIPVLANLGNVVKGVVDFFREHETVAIALGVAVGVVAVAVAVSLIPTLIASAAALWANVAAALALAAPFIGIAALVAALTAAVIYAYQNWDWFRAVVDGVAHFFSDTLWPILKGIGSWITDSFVPTVVGISTAVAGVAVDIYNVFEGIVGFIIGLPGRIAAAARGMWDGITSAFKDAINAIIGLWNRFDLAIPGIQLPGWMGGMGWGGIGDVVPDIPYLDTGGIIRRQTLAMVHPNEAVVPLPADWRNGGGIGGTTVMVMVPATAHPRETALELERLLGGRSAGLNGRNR